MTVRAVAWLSSVTPVPRIYGHGGCSKNYLLVNLLGSEVATFFTVGRGNGMLTELLVTHVFGWRFFSKLDVSLVSNCCHLLKVQPTRVFGFKYKDDACGVAFSTVVQSTASDFTLTC